MPTLYLIGTPLDEAQKLSPEAVNILLKSHTVIGESRKVVDRYLKGHAITQERFFLDPYRKEEWLAFTESLSKMKPDDSVCLLSDVGMPVLFDPGFEVLDLCRKKNFTIKTVPSATSWATACAVSGFEPPFYIQGFLDRDNDIRHRQLAFLKTLDAHTVLMETPYRYGKFVQMLAETFGNDAQVFLAWNIAQETEKYFWGSLKELAVFNQRANLEKGEFVLIVKRRTDGKRVK